MKFKVQSLLAAFVAGMVLVPGIQAQTDITDQYLTNPDFEYAEEGLLWADKYPDGGPERGDPYGWSRNGELIGNSYGINADGMNYTNKALCWYNSSPMPDLLEVYQEIEGLPAGDYLVTCKLGIFADRISNQRLFANNNVQYFMNEESLVNIPKVEGEINTYAGLITTPSGLANLQGMLVMVTIGENESLKLGIRSSNYMTNGERNGSTNYGWFKMDDFKLYYLEEGIIGYHKAKLMQVIQRLNPIDETMLPYGDYDDMILDISTAQDVYDSSNDPDEVAAEVVRMEERFEEIELSMASWSILTTLVNEEYPALKKLAYDGLPELEEAYVKVIGIREAMTTKKAEVDQAIEDFNAAIAVYKYSGYTKAAINNPFDFNWFLKDPSFDNWTESTTWDLFQHMATGDLYKLTKNFVEIWRDGGQGFYLPNSYAYQVIEGLPNGIYDLEASMIACNQGEKELPHVLQIEGVYIMANTSISPVTTQQDPETYNQASSFKVRTIVTDGTLIAGVKVYDSNASWVAIDDLKLTYYGSKDLATYQEVYADQLDKAKGMLDRDVLPIERKALEDVIQAAESAAPSTIEALGTAIGNLSAAMMKLEDAERQQAAFKAASYNKALMIGENPDGLYDENVVGLMENVIPSVNDVLNASSTTMEVYPELTATLDKYLSYVDSYQALKEFQQVITEDALYELIDDILTTQTEQVIANENKIEESKELFASVISFAKAYETAVTCIYSDEYPQEAVVKLSNVMREELGKLKVDFSYVEKAEAAVNKALGDMRFNEIVPGKDAEVTDLAIVNPTVDAPENNAMQEGWTINKGVGNTFSNKGQHWTGDSENRYLDSYNGNWGSLKYTALQEIKGVPNGTYVLRAAVRSAGEGAYLYAVGGGKIFTTEITNGGDKGGSIWENAEEGSPEKEANNGLGRGWNWMDVADINVNDNVITIGVSTDVAVTGGKAFTGQWFSADDFKLFYVSDKFIITGLEDVNADQSELIVYAENGYIKVQGEETYTVTTLSGVQVSSSSQLTAGIYIVKAGNKTAKVMVK